MSSSDNTSAPGDEATLLTTGTLAVDVETGLGDPTLGVDATLGDVVFVTAGIGAMFAGVTPVAVAVVAVAVVAVAVVVVVVVGCVPVGGIVVLFNTERSDSVCSDTEALLFVERLGSADGVGDGEGAGVSLERTDSFGV